MKTVQVKDRHDSTLYNLDIEPRHSVRIYGENPNRRRYIPETVNGITTYHTEDYTQTFDLTFKIGDQAVYGSYNLTYTGRIVAIGEKTITIDARGTGEHKKRLTWDTFSWRNWDFNAERIAKENAEEMMCI